MPATDSLDLKDYIQILLRGKWIIIFTSVIAVGIAVYQTLTTKPVYEATVTVLINTKGQGKSVPFLDVGDAGGKNIRNELEVLKSRSLNESVANELLERKFVDDSGKVMLEIIQSVADDRPQGSLTSREAIVSRIQKSMSYEPVRDSDILRIIAKGTNPREAALLANTVAEVYSDRNLQVSRTRTKAVKEFLESQLKAKQTSLASAEDSLQGYMQRSGIVTLDQEATRVATQLADFEAQRDAADIQLESLSKALATYQKQAAQYEPNIAKFIGEANDPYIRRLQDELAKLEVQKDITIAQNPNAVTQDIFTQKLREIDAQISSLRTQLEKRTRDFLKSLVPGQGASSQGTDAVGYLTQIKQKILEIQIEQQSLQAKKSVLKTFIDDFEAKFAQIPRQSIELARLQRARFSTEKLFTLVEEKFNEASISEQSEFGYVDVIDKAAVPRSPMGPNMRNNLLYAMLIGFGLGIVLSVLREYLDVRIRTPEDLRKHGFVPMAMIEPMNGELPRGRNQDSLFVDGKRVDPHLLTIVNPLTPISESFRRLRTNVQYARVDEPIRTLLITSPNPSEGKSTIVSNLAVVFAQSGKRVLLIDSDLRKPVQHLEFGLKQEPGLCDFLFGEVSDEKLIVNHIVENLDVIASGRIPPNPSEVLGSKSFEDFIARKKNEYDLVLLDSPPVLAVTDTLILATDVDGVVLVTFSGKTGLESLQRSIESLQGVGAKPLGIVLNYFDVRKAYGGYYSKSYGHHYHYYGSTQSGNGRKEDRRKKA